MTTASLASYTAIVDKLKGKRFTVFSMMRARAMTIREACDMIGWPYNTVSARICELTDRGLIKESGDTRNGQTVWIASRPEEVGFLAQRRAEEKAGVQAKIVAYEGVGGPAAFGPYQTMRVTVEMTRAQWQRLKNCKTGRFS